MPNANLFVSYDLHTPGQGYAEVLEKIKALGIWARVHYSLYYVRSPYTAEQALAHVWAAMDTNDRLIVIDATNSRAVWQNLPPDVSALIRAQWNL